LGFYSGPHLGNNEFQVPIQPRACVGSSHPNLRDVRTVAGDYHPHDLSQAMTRDNGALTADILHTWQRLGDNRSTFCFAVDRDHARQLKEQFEAAGVPSAYIGCREIPPNTSAHRSGLSG
jgi:hypothetical protein